ncbi:Ig-like domain repeat protein [Streptomyces sp. 110]|uniref:Ig-like domain repeat protein n=1 Tax=Streptomyces endocoffeicus TaxID=2898945 RepID=A0ABS1PJW7_9ACTN|nr:Ig-like domain-containing protein [Streptomyces endocoffeicus]MBL1112692.1 Ig-like domain repeat protein [Streptomyces endocoffeicus]
MSTTTVTSTPNPSVFGQSVTYTATVTGITTGTPPWGDVTFVIAGGPTIGPVTLTQTGVDSGTASVTDSTLAVGSHLVTANFANSSDPVDNSSGTTIQQVNQAATTTTVTFVPPAPVCGETVTLTASVAAVPPGSGTPTGTVTFIISADGPTVTGTLDAAGNASVTVPALSVGTHQVAAFYNGDANFAPSNSPLTPLTINPAASTTTLTSSPASPVCGETVTLCAQVSVVAPGTCTPTGTVTFAVDGVPFVVGAIDASGQVCVTNSNIPVGTHTVTATYNGNGNVAGSTGTGSVTVGQGASTTTVSVSPAAPVCGESITICAQVTVQPPSTCTPTGTVTFVINGTSLTAMLDETGQACVTTNLTAGSYTVTAGYGGSTDIASSTGTASFTVGQGVSGISASISPSPSVCGEPVTICADVSVAPPSTCIPTGNVTFAVSGGPTLTGTLDATGQACVTTSAIPVGTHSVTITYPGDGDVLGSTTTLPLTVNQASSTTSLTITPPSSSCGQSVTLCAQVTTTPPGTCTPTGTVTFAIAGGPTLTGTLNGSGQACVSTGVIPVGTHAVTATYGGNTGVAGSSASGSVTVGQAASTTALTITPVSPVCGQSVTLCAQVTTTPPGTCTPTGTVTFTIAGGPTLTGTLNGSGQACVSTSAIPVGTHAVTATYGGNTGVAGSSASGSVTVGQAASTTALTITPVSPVCGQSVTLCAQVTTTPPGTCTPTGTVTFTIAGGPTLTGTLNGSGQACVTTSAIPVGTHSVTATYAGNTGVAGSSASGSVTVGQANTTTTLTSSPNPSTPGQNVTFTATVTAVPPATGTPTGNVTFVISGGPTLIGTLNGAGQATVSTNTLTTGAHTVTATYGGDTCFAGSTSPTITQNVVAAPTGTTVTATPATIRLRMNGTLIILTLSATLRDASNNPIPGQTLTFVANSALGPIVLGSAVTNASGTATLSNVTVPPTVLTASTYTASFAGAPGLSPSSGSASLTFQPSPILP